MPASLGGRGGAELAPFPTTRDWLPYLLRDAGAEAATAARRTAIICGTMDGVSDNYDDSDQWAASLKKGDG